MAGTHEKTASSRNAHAASKAEEKSPPGQSKERDIGWGPRTVHDVLIPPHVGRGRIKTYYQRRTLAQYLLVSSAGLWGFHSMQNASYRATALGLLFPGAGFFAVGTIPAIIAAVTTIALLLVSAVIYFALGAISIGLMVWLISSFVAGLMAREDLFETSGWICPLLAYGGLVYWIIKTHFEDAASSRIAAERNTWLVEAVEEHLANAKPAPAPGSRELPLETLRHIQYAIERGLTARDDWSMHDVIEQFQSSSLRYQLYSLSDAICLYQSQYTPNFHGYVSEAARNAIEKSFQKKVVSFWKWEAMFGYLNFTDWNPIKKDNIMVTGYVAASIGMYTRATGDKRYQEKDCLEFVVTENQRFKTDYQGIIDALSSNMNNNVFTLYPCEPQWTFTVCNLIGFSALTMSDNILHRHDALDLKSRFERSLEEEFTNRDGSVLTCRSELTGFPLRMLDTTMFKMMVTMLLHGVWPHIGHRNYAILKREIFERDEKGQLRIKALAPGDKRDPGNYGGKAGTICAWGALVSGEYGDEQIRQEALDQLDAHFPVEATSSGSIRNKGMSALQQSLALMARLVRREDLANATRLGPPEVTMRGPLLVDAPFPDVLVAKAFSKNGEELELVLYNGREPGTFKLGFERLNPHTKYNLSTGSSFYADEVGTATVDVSVDGRTQVLLSKTS
ncbi:hypothetical protein NX059_011795 [Plenodomus lindquistii]|nr:hypothetical protein NX059_011795 [Plenodomus lindquistii]